MLAIDTATGVVRWAVNTDGLATDGSALHGGTAFFPSDCNDSSEHCTASHLFALHAATEWNLSIPTPSKGGSARVHWPVVDRSGAAVFVSVDHAEGEGSSVCTAPSDRRHCTLGPERSSGTLACQGCAPKLLLWAWRIWLCSFLLATRASRCVSLHSVRQVAERCGVSGCEARHTRSLLVTE